MTEIKKEKPVSVYFYKLASSYDGFNQPLAHISEEQADKLIKMFQSEKIPADSCMSELMYFSKNKITRENNTNVNKNLYITDFYWGGMKFLCAEPSENIQNMDANNLHRISSCFQHLTTGKCKCPFMANTVGKVLFPQFYANQK